MLRKTSLLMIFLLVSLIIDLYFPSYLMSQNVGVEKPMYRKSLKNVCSINLVAAITLGTAFKRLHIPINYERVVRSDKSIVIGCHPAIPITASSSGEAFGASLRMRLYNGFKAPEGFWKEIGLWGIYQNKKNCKREQSFIERTYGNSMTGFFLSFGYKYIRAKDNLIIEPFMGIALPALTISKGEAELLGTPFPWAGLSVGFVF